MTGCIDEDRSVHITRQAGICGFYFFFISANTFFSLVKVTETAVLLYAVCVLPLMCLRSFKLSTNPSP